MVFLFKILLRLCTVMAGLINKVLESLFLSVSLSTYDSSSITTFSGAGIPIEASALQSGGQDFQAEEADLLFLLYIESTCSVISGHALFSGG